MNFGGEERVAATFHIGRSDAHQRKGLVYGAVEQYMVVSHVQMPVIVDPRGLDPHDRGHEWGEENGFDVGAIEHVMAEVSTRVLAKFDGIASKCRAELLQEPVILLRWAHHC